MILLVGILMMASASVGLTVGLLINLAPQFPGIEKLANLTPRPALETDARDEMYG